MTITDEDETIINNLDTYKVGNELRKESGNYYPVYAHENEVYLEAGTHYFNASAAAATSTSGANSKVQLFVDCLKIEPVVVAPTEIPAEGKQLKIIEYNNYMTRPSTARNDATHGAFIGELAGATNTTLMTELSFEKSGYYNVKYHGTAYKNGGWSKINFYMEDVLL